MKGGYAGSIKNGANQVVKAPKQSTDPKKGTVKPVLTCGAGNSEE